MKWLHKELTAALKSFLDKSNGITTKKSGPLLREPGFGGSGLGSDINTSKVINDDRRLSDLAISILEKHNHRSRGGNDTTSGSESGSDISDDSHNDPNHDGHDDRVVRFHTSQESKAGIEGTDMIPLVGSLKTGIYRGSYYYEGRVA